MVLRIVQQAPDMNNDAHSSSKSIGDNRTRIRQQLKANGGSAAASPSDTGKSSITSGGDASSMFVFGECV